MQNNEQKARYARAFIGEISRVDSEKQMQICTEAINGIEGVSELTAFYKPTEFDRFVKNLRRDEIAVIARISGIAERKPNERPGIAFYDRLIQLLQSKAVYILDAHTGITSLDGEPWRQLYLKAGRSITRGRELSSEKGAAMATKRHESKEPGLEEYWKSMKNTDEYNRLASHWRDPIHKNARAAIASSPNEELRSASVSMWTRIFEGRRGKRKSINE